YIEVSQNHRYTVNITKADEYHLDFTINVEDWTDEGNIDDYEPGGEADENGVTVNVGGGDVTYDVATRMVTMPIVDGTQFTMEGGSTAGYYVTMYYEGNDTEHQWLTIDPLADNMTKADVTPVIYTIKKDATYTDTKYPIAFIRFTDKISAKETIVIVQPFAKPTVLVNNLSNGSTYADNVLSLYQSTAISQPTVTLNVFASGGSRLEFIGWTTPVNWLTIAPAVEQNISLANYILTLNSSDASFPDPYPLEGKTFTFTNKANEEMKETVTLKLKSDLTITSTTVAQAEFDNSSSTLKLFNNENDKVKLTVNTIGGSDVLNVPSWLIVTKEDEGKNQTIYTFNVASGTTTNMNADITIRSKADNTIIKTYKVYAISRDVTFSTPTKNSDYTTVSNFTSTTPTISYFACEGSYVEFKVTSPKGVTVVNGSWCNLDVMSETTLSTGQKQTTIRMNRINNDNWHGTPTNDCNASVTDKYSGSLKKNITVKQYQIVYPGSKVPPTLVKGYWVAPVNSVSSISYNDMRSRVTNGTACPSNWRIPTHSEYLSLAGISGGNTLAYDLNSYPELKAAYRPGSGEVHYWASNDDRIGYGLRFVNGKFSTWTLGDKNISNLRCIKNK
ncbi:hypothetical protein NBH14_19545, partial [Parabacteroides sp. TA-V-105]|nr:hypothetical protein [Parabacteroides sp. TA-V-105]